MNRTAILAACVLLASVLGSIGDAPRAALAVGPTFGDGSAGAVTFAVNTQFIPPVDGVVSSGAASGSALTLASSSGAFVPGQKVLIHQTRGSSAGTWELNSVQSYFLGTIATSVPLSHTYASTGGADRAQVLVVPQYTNVTVNLGVTVSAKPWNGSTGGILAFLANGTVTLQGSLVAARMGFVGSTRSTQNIVETGGQGEGTGGASNTQSAAANGNGGSGGQGFLNSTDVALAEATAR